MHACYCSMHDNILMALGHKNSREAEGAFFHKNYRVRTVWKFGQKAWLRDLNRRGIKINKFFEKQESMKKIANKKGLKKRMTVIQQLVDYGLEDVNWFAAPRSS